MSSEAGGHRLSLLSLLRVALDSELLMYLRGAWRVGARLALWG